MIAARHGISVVNGPGLIDPNYRGEIRVVLVNLGDEPFAGEPGDRIAQLVIQRVERAVFHEVETLPGSARGDGGFGSTGGYAGNVQADRKGRVAGASVQHSSEGA